MYPLLFRTCSDWVYRGCEEPGNQATAAGLGWAEISSAIQMHPLSRSQALEAAFMDQRSRLLRFIAARGSQDEAEDILQELWLRLASAPDPLAAAQPAYMVRAADRLIIDRFRSLRQAALRERSWAEVQPGFIEGSSHAPDAGRVMEGRQHVRLVEAALLGVGERAAAIFRRHRIEGAAQRQIAEEFAVSLSTVESDLRRAYKVLSEIRGLIDEV